VAEVMVTVTNLLLLFRGEKNSEILSTFGKVTGENIVVPSQIENGLGYCCAIYIDK